MLEDRENAIYIPPDWQKGKSERPRVVPLDVEMRQLLYEYLLIRPESPEPWLFLTKHKDLKMDDTNVSDVWHKYFRPEYGPNERYRGISAHYGRHFFTTWFSEQMSATEAQIKYLRGDKQ